MNFLDFDKTGVSLMYGMFYKKQIFFVLYLIENWSKNQPLSCFTEEIHLLLICVVLVRLGSVFIFLLRWRTRKKGVKRTSQWVGIWVAGCRAFGHNS